jgi:hypothetical protein
MLLKKSGLKYDLLHHALKQTKETSCAIAIDLIITPQSVFASPSLNEYLSCWDNYLCVDKIKESVH